MSQQLITTLDLMRHGEPVGGRKYRGQADDPLSELGWLQMRQALGSHCPWQVVISSPLARCVDFARELSTRHELPVEIDPRLIELGFGSWEGRTPDELLAENPEILVKFRSDPLTYAPPGSEPLTAFHNRIVSVWSTLLELHSGKHLLVIAHAGVIRMMVAHVLGIPLRYLFRLQVANASLTRIRVEKRGEYLLPQIVFHGGSL
ncbi:MAG: histidine phosphatase family protein [Sulfuricaulis sp.]